MEDLSVDVLLEFLYNRFAVTFLMCMFGSFMREAFLPNKKTKSKMLNSKKIVTSTVFSTFLMCTIADYIDLTFSAYIVLSIICGIWGLWIVQIAVNQNFVVKFLMKLIEKIPDSIIKDTAKSASEALCDCCKNNEDEDKKDSDSTKVENEDNVTEIEKDNKE